jgi:hypothetical protein
VENSLKYFAELKYPRVERHRYAVLEDLSLLDASAEWTSLQGFGRIKAERYHKASGKTEHEIRYCITNLKSCPASHHSNCGIL